MHDNWRKSRISTCTFYDHLCQRTRPSLNIFYCLYDSKGLTTRSNNISCSLSRTTVVYISTWQEPLFKLQYNKELESIILYFRAASKGHKQNISLIERDAWHGHFSCIHIQQNDYIVLNIICYQISFILYLCQVLCQILLVHVFVC